MKPLSRTEVALHHLPDGRGYRGPVRCREARDGLGTRRDLGSQAAGPRAWVRLRAACGRSAGDDWSSCGTWEEL